MEKDTKELNNIKKSINQWFEKHKGNVVFIGSFSAFKGKECNVVDDLIVGFGPKGAIKIILKDFDRMVKKEKRDFISW